MLKFLSAALFLSLATACGSAKQEQSTQMNQAAEAKVRPLAEYEAADTIILSFPLVEEAKGTKMREEFSLMMKKMLANTSAEIAFYSRYQTNLAERFYEFFPEVSGYSSRIKLMPVYEEFVDLNALEEYDDFGTWMRDASPISGIDETTGKPVLYNMQYGMPGEVPLADSVPLHFAKTKGLDIIDVPIEFEGGNFMSTRQGVCAISWGITGKNSNALAPEKRDAILKDKLGCKSIIFLEEMPGAIAHSDMIAKFLDDSTVAITEFSSDEVYFNGKVRICPSGSLSEDCPEASFSRPAGRYSTNELGDWLKDEIDKNVAGEFDGKLGGEGEDLFRQDDKKLRLSELSKTWRKQFEDAGFKVVMLPTPPPTTEIYVTQQGNVWTNMELEYVTYANALIFGDKIFVPSYQYDDRIKAANPKALTAWESTGLKVIPIETSELTMGREGSIHCMSMSLRTK